MIDRTVLALVLSLVVTAAAVPVVSTVAPVDAGWTGSDEPDAAGHPGSVPSLEERLSRIVEDGDAPTDPIEREVYVVVQMKQGAVFDDSRFDLPVYDREGARVARGYVPLTAVRDLSNDPRVEAVRIERSRLRTAEPLVPSTDGNVAGGVSTIGADELQVAGLTGRNVTVGVIDAGFRVSDPELAGHVGAFRSFDDEEVDWVHGTAVASVVADTAPDARLHLAAIGESTTPEEYREAVEWLRDSGADVIVDAGSYFGQPGDGSGEIETIASAAARDVVFVAAAGNYAERHWQGTHDPSAGVARVEFAPGETANYLEGGAPFGGTVSATLRWDDWETTDGSDYEILLLRRQPGLDTVVATSTSVEDRPVEHLTARVPRGRYYLVVRATAGVGSGPNTDTDTLDLFASRGLTHGSPAGSLTAPGTAPGVLTVGALDGPGSVAGFSSRGPVSGTDRLGVDLVAPDDVALPGVSTGSGTSYAAPYAAGTAALLVEAHPSLGPRGVREVLRNSATDLGPAGPDTVSGYGRLDARAAAELAVEYERYADVNASAVAHAGPN